MGVLSKKSQEYVLALACNAILQKLGMKSVDLGKVPEELIQKAGTFVTLSKNGDLRGCIGLIEPIQTIYEGVIDNAKKAAFGDPRFSPVTSDELDDLTVEVSVLTTPRELEVGSTEELLTILGKTKPGVIISQGWASATFLPQVWEELSEPELFLSNLCMKAGFPPHEWMEPGALDIKTYEVEHFSRTFYEKQGKE